MTVQTPDLFNDLLCSLDDARRQPERPGSYDYRRAALDALHFPRLVDRCVQSAARRETCGESTGSSSLPRSVRLWTRRMRAETSGRR